MKNFLTKHAISLTLTAIFLVIFIFGGMYSRYMANQLLVHLDTVTVESLDYNYDTTTFVAYPYLANVTYGDNETTVVYLDPEFQIGGSTESTLTSYDLEQVQTEVDAMTLLDVDVVSFNETTQTLVISNHGAYENIPIVVTIYLSADLTTIVDFDTTENETYDQYNGYSGDPEPYVEDYYLNALKDNHTTAIDSVAGATLTSDAMQEIVDYLAGFLAYQAGGAN